MTAPDAPSVAARWTAISILCAIIAVFVVHGAYFSVMLAPLRHEQVYMAIASGRTWGAIPPYAALMALWSAGSGFDLTFARAFSVLCGVGSILFAYRIGCRLMTDAPSGAAFTLSFILFPPLVATYSTVGPHALFAMLLLAALDSLQCARSVESWTRQAGVAIQSGACAALAGILSPLGFVVVPLWFVATALIVSSGRAWTISLATAAIFTVAWSALVGLHPLPTDTELVASNVPFVTTILLPFAMVAVSAGLSAATLWSSKVRTAMGRGGAILALVGFLAAGSVLSLAVQFGWMRRGEGLTSIGYLFPLAIFAPWPLIVWARRVMPLVTSIWAWVAFPVIMYSCFWVILGPIGPDRFPYSHRLETTFLERF
ncbi:MAG: hypothetical protein SFV19_00210 [Rhodospirillaceae bacterium]|nr:hypothetical protein [Rhodospirillaceae bacterium]